VLAGARRRELLTSIEVAASELLPGARARVVSADEALGAAPEMLVHELEAAEDTVLLVDVADVSPWRMTSAAVTALDTLCRQAGVALAYADARAEVRRLAVAGERDRIARDLHDTVIQRLFGAGLQLDAVTRRADESVADAVERVIEEVDAAIAELRSTIARLDTPEPSGLVDRTAAVVAALTPACPGLVQLEVEGDLAEVPRPVAEDLPAVLREGITNAAKHAAADTVRPRIVVEDDVVEVTVTDDGVGPGVGAHPAAVAPASLGLRNLAARAERHGGTCVLEPAAPTGSRLVWRAPRR
jgi:signal transduction histidine kinase